MCRASEAAMYPTKSKMFVTLRHLVALGQKLAKRPSDFESNCHLLICSPHTMDISHYPLKLNTKKGTLLSTIIISYELTCS